jgi:hypothetical protein
MPTTITKALTSIAPVAARIESKRETRNQVHEIIGRTDPDITFGGTGLRTGSIVLLLPNHATALDAEAFLASPGVFTLDDSELLGLNMRFVASGSIGLEVFDTLTHWVLTVEFQEVQ